MDRYVDKCIVLTVKIAYATCFLLGAVLYHFLGWWAVVVVVG